MSWDFNNEQKFEVVCHTTAKSENVSFIKGEKYLMETEVVHQQKDTNNKPCILCWVHSNENFGSRFAIIGNVYADYNSQGNAGVSAPYWRPFTNWFYDPFVLKRDEQLKSIGI